MASGGAIRVLPAGNGHYYDLRLEAVAKSGSSLQAMLDRAAMLGYSCVAVNMNWNPIDTGSGAVDGEKTSKKKRASTVSNVPDPASLRYTSPIVQRTGVPLRVLSRLTVTLNDTSVVHLLNRLEVKKFDIFAVVPTTTETFLSACKSLSVDVIGIDYDGFRRGVLHTNHYKLAVRRGLVFELTYAQLLAADSVRRRAFTTAHLVSNIHCARGLLITSGAKHHHELRSPHDVPSLGYLLSVPEHLARAGISTIAESVTIRAYGRLHLGGRGMQVVFKCDKLSPPVEAEVASSHCASAAKRSKIS